MHAEEWIQQHGRFMRTIGMTQLRKELGRNKGECTWCGIYKKGLNRWCSEACKSEGYLRNGMDVKFLVHRRDKGICAICGLDTDSIVKRLHAADRRVLAGRWVNAELKYFRCRVWVWPLLKRISKARLSTSFHGTPYEIDHIVPVVEGGGLCGLDGFRTLCIPCHKEETKALARRRKIARDKAKQ